VGQPLDSPAVVKAAELVKQLFEKYTTPDAVGANWAVSSGHFLAGRTAMIIDGPWLISLINDQVEDPTQIGVAVAPTYKGGKGQPGLIVTDAMTPWAAGKQPTKEREEAIVDFMKYFTSEESVKIITLEGNLPLAVKATFTEEELKAADPLLAQVIVIGSKAPEAVVSMTRILKPPASEKLPALLEGLALGQISPEEFAKKLQEFNK
ncbi:MAG TPA: extracellular solute-binding protein, partial [Desulfobacterales bacterium]|nr:extracellular solute-binding protein [Desulfobacterales bacterium]